jgi:phosphotriesterase-related protein
MKHRILINVIILLLTMALAVAGATTPGQSQSRALPPIPNLQGKVMSVLGPVEPKKLGITLMHEHLLISTRTQVPGVREGQHREITTATDLNLFLQPVSLENLSAIRNGIAPNRDNMSLTDLQTAIEEIAYFKDLGGKTVVDVTSVGLARDPNSLVRIAQATGLTIVMGCGWYQKMFYGVEMDRLTVEELTSQIVRDIVSGADGTTIRSGIIGEVGINGNPLTPNEMKNVRAAARASRLTGAAITFHNGGFGEERLTVLDAAIEEGADPNRIVMGHSDDIAEDLPLLKKLVDRGVYVEFDLFGRSGARLGRVSDEKVVLAVAELIRLGYVNRILLSQDVCHKIELKKYGGNGYTFVQESVLPALREFGVTDRQITTIMEENPMRVLAFAAPGKIKTGTRKGSLESSFHPHLPFGPSILPPVGYGAR